MKPHLVVATICSCSCTCRSRGSETAPARVLSMVVILGAGAYWSWLGGIRGAAGSSSPKNRTEKGLGGKFVNRVSKEVRKNACPRAGKAV